MAKGYSNGLIIISILVIMRRMIDKDMGSSIGKVLVMFIKGNGVEIE